MATPEGAITYPIGEELSATALTIGQAVVARLMVREEISNRQGRALPQSIDHGTVLGTVTHIFEAGGDEHRLWLQTATDPEVPFVLHTGLTQRSLGNDIQVAVQYALHEAGVN